MGLSSTPSKSSDARNERKERREEKKINKSLRKQGRTFINEWKKERKEDSDSSQKIQQVDKLLEENQSEKNDKLKNKYLAVTLGYILKNDPDYLDDEAMVSLKTLISQLDPKEELKATQQSLADLKKEVTLTTRSSSSHGESISGVDNSLEEINPKDVKKIGKVLEKELIGISKEVRKLLEINDFTIKGGSANKALTRAVKALKSENPGSLGHQSSLGDLSSLTSSIISDGEYSDLKDKQNEFVSKNDTYQLLTPIDENESSDKDPDTGESHGSEQTNASKEFKELRTTNLKRTYRALGEMYKLGDNSQRLISSLSRIQISTLKEIVQGSKEVDDIQTDKTIKKKGSYKELLEAYNAEDETGIKLLIDDLFSLDGLSFSHEKKNQEDYHRVHELYTAKKITSFVESNEPKATGFHPVLQEKRDSLSSGSKKLLYLLSANDGDGDIDVYANSLTKKEKIQDHKSKDASDKANRVFTEGQKMDSLMRALNVGTKPFLSGLGKILNDIGEDKPKMSNPEGVTSYLIERPIVLAKVKQYIEAQGEAALNLFMDYDGKEDYSDRFKERVSLEDSDVREQFYKDLEGTVGISKGITDFQTALKQKYIDNGETIPPEIQEFLLLPDETKAERMKESIFTLFTTTYDDQYGGGIAWSQMVALQENFFDSMTFFSSLSQGGGGLPEGIENVSGLTASVGVTFTKELNKTIGKNTRLFRSAGAGAKFGNILNLFRENRSASASPSLSTSISAVTELPRSDYARLAGADAKSISQSINLSLGSTLNQIKDGNIGAGISYNIGFNRDKMQGNLDRATERGDTVSFLFEDFLDTDGGEPTQEAFEQKLTEQIGQENLDKLGKKKRDSIQRMIASLSSFLSLNYRHLLTDLKGKNLTEEEKKGVVLDISQTLATMVNQTAVNELKNGLDSLHLSGLSLGVGLQFMLSLGDSPSVKTGTTFSFGGRGSRYSRQYTKVNRISQKKAKERAFEGQGTEFLDGDLSKRVDMINKFLLADKADANSKLLVNKDMVYLPVSMVENGYLSDIRISPSMKKYVGLVDGSDSPKLAIPRSLNIHLGHLSQRGATGNVLSIGGDVGSGATQCEPIDIATVTTDFLDISTDKQKENTKELYEAEEKIVLQFAGDEYKQQIETTLGSNELYTEYFDLSKTAVSLISKDVGMITLFNKGNQSYEVALYQKRDLIKNGGDFIFKNVGQVSSGEKGPVFTSSEESLVSQESVNPIEFSEVPDGVREFYNGEQGATALLERRNKKNDDSFGNYYEAIQDANYASAFSILNTEVSNHGLNITDPIDASSIAQLEYVYGKMSYVDRTYLKHLNDGETSRKVMKLLDELGFDDDNKEVLNGALSNPDLFEQNITNIEAALQSIDIKGQKFDTYGSYNNDGEFVGDYNSNLIENGVPNELHQLAFLITPAWFIAKMRQGFYNRRIREEFPSDPDLANVYIKNRDEIIKKMQNQPSVSLPAIGDYLENPDGKIQNYVGYITGYPKGAGIEEKYIQSPELFQFDGEGGLADFETNNENDKKDILSKFLNDMQETSPHLIDERLQSLQSLLPDEANYYVDVDDLQTILLAEPQLQTVGGISYNVKTAEIGGEKISIIGGDLKSAVFGNCVNYTVILTEMQVVKKEMVPEKIALDPITIDIEADLQGSVGISAGMAMSDSVRKKTDVAYRHVDFQRAKVERGGRSQPVDGEGNIIEEAENNFDQYHYGEGTVDGDAGTITLSDGTVIDIPADQYFYVESGGEGAVYYLLPSGTLGVWTHSEEPNVVNAFLGNVDLIMPDVSSVPVDPNGDVHIEARTETANNLNLQNEVRKAQLDALISKIGKNIK